MRPSDELAPHQTDDSPQPITRVSVMATKHFNSNFNNTPLYLSTTDMQMIRQYSMEGLSFLTHNASAQQLFERMTMSMVASLDDKLPYREPVTVPWIQLKVASGWIGRGLAFTVRSMSV